MQFTDGLCRHKVGVLYTERLVSCTALLIDFHYQQFVVRQCQLGQYEHIAHRGFSVHRRQAVIRPYRLDEVLLAWAVRLATFLSMTLKRI